MFFWKIDDETIRCLINKEEIGQMGFDLKELGEDNEQMEEFLNAVIADSKNYIEWNTENGVQNYIARALPSEQFLITISCTFQDDTIDSIYSMTGEEKEREFESLARDLHDVCIGNTSESEKDTEEAAKNVQNTSSEVSYQQSAPTKPSGSTMTDKEKKQQAVRPHIPAQKLIFDNFHNLMDFCSLLNKYYFIPSSLYKKADKYILLVEFPVEMDNSQIITFMITAEEYGAECSNQRLEGYYLSEHAKLIIKDKAVETLFRMN